MAKRYVIGDIHGSLEELKMLLVKIRKDAAGEGYRLIFVGDYVDRGPDSAGVISLIRILQGMGAYAIKGNHEELLLMGEFLYARETLASFPDGVIPEDVSKWMEMLPTYYEDDTIIVAHAAIEPGVPMEYQTNNWLMWVRYDSGRPAHFGNGKHFYHGHTPFIRKTPEGADDRTNVDTGCVFGGYLTAAAVGDDGKPTHFVQVAAIDGEFDRFDKEI